MFEKSTPLTEIMYTRIALFHTKPYLSITGIAISQLASGPLDQQTRICADFSFLGFHVSFLVLLHHYFLCLLVFFSFMRSITVARPHVESNYSYVCRRRTHLRLRATIATHEVGRARNCTRLLAGRNYSLQLHLHTCFPHTTTSAHLSLGTRNYSFAHSLFPHQSPNTYSKVVHELRG